MAIRNTGALEPYIYEGLLRKDKAVTPIPMSQNLEVMDLYESLDYYLTKKQLPIIVHQTLSPAAQSPTGSSDHQDGHTPPQASVFLL